MLALSLLMGCLYCCPVILLKLRGYSLHRQLSTGGHTRRMGCMAWCGSPCYVGPGTGHPGYGLI